MMKKSVSKLEIITAFVLILSTAIFSSCGGTQATSEIHAVRLIISASVNWDKVIGPDGVQFSLKPQDIDGWPVKGEMTVNASLWSQPDVLKKEKGKLIQEWKDIRVTRHTYDKDAIARMRLEYLCYAPQPNEYGILEIEIQTSDGKVFSFEETNIQLGHSSGENKEQAPSGCCPL